MQRYTKNRYSFPKLVFFSQFWKAINIFGDFWGRLRSRNSLSRGARGSSVSSCLLTLISIGLCIAG